MDGGVAPVRTFLSWTVQAQATSTMRSFPLIAFLLGTSMPAAAQSDCLVQKQVLDWCVELAKENLSLSHALHYSSLSNGETERLEMTLNGGSSYRITAVCDGDCGDLDLCLYDENGDQVACDTSEDSVPMLSVEANASSGATLEVKMYNCAVNPCHYAVAIFSGR